MRKNLTNKAKCLKCNSIIESHYCGHFVSCKCFSDKSGIFLDGGIESPRCGYHSEDEFLDMSEYIEVPDPVPPIPSPSDSLGEKPIAKGIEIQLHDLIPVPWKAPTIGKAGAYNNRASYVRYVRILIAQKYTGPVLKGPIRCEMTFYLPITESESEKKKEAMHLGKIKHTKTPDLTNLMKLHEDCLQGIVLDNDSHIYESHIKKCYSKNTGILIRVEETEHS